MTNKSCQMSSSPPKRRRVARSPSPTYKLDDEEDYQPFVSAAQRRKEKLAKFTSWAGPSTQSSTRRQQEQQENEDAEKEEERERERARRERTLLVEAQEVLSHLSEHLSNVSTKFPNSQRTQKQNEIAQQLADLRDRI